MKTIEMDIDNVLVIIHYNELPEHKVIEDACIQFMNDVCK